MNGMIGQRERTGMMNRWKAGILGWLVLLFLPAGCTTHPAVPYTLEIPPVTLAPTATAGVEDGRGRFREIYCAVRDAHGRTLPDDKPCNEVVLRLNNEPEPTGRPVNLDKPSPSSKLHIVVVPGIFSECIANDVSTYSDAIAYLKSLGYKVSFVQVSGRGSCAFNAKQIRDFVVNNIPAGEKLILIGYSKGLPDILEAIVAYSDLQDRTLAVAGIAGVVAGSPMADAVTHPLERLVEKVKIKSCEKADGGAIDSLQPETRLAWLASHTLPTRIKYFSLAAITTPKNVAEVLLPSYELLSTIDPRNDSQVIFYDAIIPGSTLLGYVNADHFAVAMPFDRNPSSPFGKLVNHNAFPREVLLESIVRFVEEKVGEGK